MKCKEVQVLASESFSGWWELFFFCCLVAEACRNWTGWGNCWAAIVAFGAKSYCLRGKITL